MEKSNVFQSESDGNSVQVVLKKEMDMAVCETPSPGESRALSDVVHGKE